MHVARTTTLTAVAGLALATLTACSGTAAASEDRVTSNPEATQMSDAVSDDSADSTPEAKQVSVSSVGFVVDEYGSHAVYGSVNNPTDDVAYIEVNFAAYDAAGTVLGTTFGSVFTRAQAVDQIVVTEISIPDGSIVAKVDAQANVAESQLDEHPDVAMTATNVAVVSDDYSANATGTIDSTYTESVTYVNASALCTDAAGTIVAAGHTYLNGKVVHGTPAPFSISLTSSSTPTACTVTAGLSILSESS